MNDMLDDSINKILFNAIPAIALIVDDNVRILEYNSAASKLLGDDRNAVFKVRGGEAMRCIHSDEVSEGCGHAPDCRHCAIRNSVMGSFRDDTVVRARAKLDLVHNGTTAEVFTLITASPFSINGNRFVLLIIEDISDLVELQKIIPICMSCKKIRSDEQYWTEVAAFFSKHMDLKFSHGYCPECAIKECERIDKLLGLR
jgi:hypothetical protein